MQAQEITVTATVRVRESLWKRTKIRAIEQGTSIGAIVQAALEAALEAPAERERRAKPKAQE